MSVGVHVLAALVEHALAALGPTFDVEIVETHHRAKVDAPSGTALRLADVAKNARARPRFVHGREGRPGARKPDEIGVHAVRGGDVIGDHTVLLFGDGERIELTHRASSRDLFARGALRAASWLAAEARPLPPRRHALDPGGTRRPPPHLAKPHTEPVALVTRPTALHPHFLFSRRRVRGAGALSRASRLGDLRGLDARPRTSLRDALGARQAGPAAARLPA